MSIHEQARNTVHLTALAGAATVAILPPPADAYALRAEEIAMIVRVGKLYGVKMTKSAAKGLFMSGFAQLVGEKAALAALEGANLAGPGAYPIKASIAVSLIESVGHASLRHFEGSKAAGIVCGIMEGLGGAHDAGMAASLLTDTAAVSPAVTQGTQISFGNMSTPSSSFRKAAEAMKDGKSMEYVMSYLENAIKKENPGLTDKKIREEAAKIYRDAKKSMASAY